MDFRIDYTEFDKTVRLRGGVVLNAVSWSRLITRIACPKGCAFHT